MLAKLKNKLKSKGKDSASDRSTPAGSDGASLSADDGAMEKKKNKGSVAAGLKKLVRPKRLFVLLLLIACAGTAAWVVHRFYYSDDAPPEYEPLPLAHIHLPDEIMSFSFYRLPDIYNALIRLNRTIERIDAEMARIQSIAEKYPDQSKITSREMKVWEKARADLVKAEEKARDELEAVYVLWAVDPEQGKALISSRGSDIHDRLAGALAPVTELVENLPQRKSEPEGLINTIQHKIQTLLK